MSDDALAVSFFGRKTHVPAHNLITIPPSWPFACWSLDMIGPLTIALGGFNHVLVAVDKFTKWIEYKPIVKITSDRAVDFISDIILTPLLQILALTSRHNLLGISVTTPALRSNMLQ